MVFRQVVALLALSTVLLSSGCCWHRRWACCPPPSCTPCCKPLSAEGVSFYPTTDAPPLAPMPTPLPSPCHGCVK